MERHCSIEQRNKGCLLREGKITKHTALGRKNALPVVLTPYKHKVKFHKEPSVILYTYYVLKEKSARI